MFRNHNQHVAPRTILAIVGASLLGVFASACTTAPETAPSPSGSDSDTSTSAPATSTGPGEDALYFYPPVEGATLQLTNSGITAGTSDVTVDSVTSGADGSTVTVTEVVSGSSEPVTVDRTFHTGPDGSLDIDAGAFGAAGEGFTVTATGDDIHIPSIADMEAGSTPTGETFVELTGSGVTMRNDVTYTVTGSGYESVTVPAGTVEAYVVDMALDINSSVAGAVSGTSRYWFLPGFGLVKQETSTLGMAGGSELTSSSVPLT